MINIDEPVEVVNMETLLEFIQEGRSERIEHAGFIDLNEPAIMDDTTYRSMEFKKYGYAVVNHNDYYN